MGHLGLVGRNWTAIERNLGNSPPGRTPPVLKRGMVLCNRTGDISLSGRGELPKLGIDQLGREGARGDNLKNHRCHGKKGTIARKVVIYVVQKSSPLGQPRSCMTCHGMRRVRSATVSRGGGRHRSRGVPRQQRSIWVLSPLRGR